MHTECPLVLQTPGLSEFDKKGGWSRDDAVDSWIQNIEIKNSGVDVEISQVKSNISVN